MKSIRTREIERWYRDMKVEDAIKLLRDHNKWRRGDETLEMAHPTQLGIAIETVCDAAEKLTKIPEYYQEG